MIVLISLALRITVPHYVFSDYFGFTDFRGDSVTDLSTKKARTNLGNRKEPYWQKIGKGEYLGFTRSRYVARKIP